MGGRAPSTTELLRRRSAALGDLRNRVATGDQAGNRPLLDAIDTARTTVDAELAAREEIEVIDEESRGDRRPARSSADYPAWRAREDDRARRRAAANDRIAALRAAQPGLYGSGRVASPCMSCLESAAGLAPARAGRPAPAPRPINPLARVEILNGFVAGDRSGKSDPILATSAKQWVNLAAYRRRFERRNLPAWLATINGQAVDTFDRLSRKIRIRVEFSQPGRERFWVKLVPGANKAYSAREKAAGRAYKLSHENAAGAPTWLSGTTGADGKAVVEMQVRAAAGDTWSVTGIDSYGTTHSSSGSIETIRGLFLCTLTMDTMTAVSLADAQTEFRRQKIELEVAELTPAPGRTLGHRRFVYCDDARWIAQTSDLERQARRVIRAGTYKGEPVSTFAPYLIYANFYDMSPEPTATSFAVREVSPTVPEDITLTTAYFWDPRDRRVSWFISAEAYRWDGAAWARLRRRPVKADFSLIGSDAAGYQTIRFTPHAAYAAEPRLAIRLSFRIVGGGINGFSAGEQGGGNFVAICRRHTYADRVPAEMNQTIVHEIGHKVNFTTGPEPRGSPGRESPNGSSFRWLDASPTHYRARDHVGGHCYNGAVHSTTGAVATSLQPGFGVYNGVCVMFGAGGGGRGIAFCANCSNRMLLLDIEQGWRVT